MAGVGDVIAGASAEALADTPIDDLLPLSDAALPDYRQLYFRWEREQWEAGAIDLSEDRAQWTSNRLTDQHRRSFLWELSSFYVGGQQVTDALVPFVDAAPREEQQVFLTTQLVDEARHTVFFDRFYDEVLDEEGDDMRSRLDRQADRLNTGFRTLLLEMLPEAADAIRRDPEDLTRLVEGVVLYHIIVEGSLALTHRRFLLEYLRKENLLPGFRGGFTAVARDESRHVGFGVRFLKEMVVRDERYGIAAQSALARMAPIALTVVEPPDGDMSYYAPLPYSADDLTVFAVDSLDNLLRVIGLDLNLAIV